MSSMLNNPNVKKNKAFQRKQSLKPENSFSLDDLKNDNKDPENNKKPERTKSVSEVTFDTTVRIDNHVKNFLKAMTVLGMAKNQSEALKITQATWKESLTDTERQTLDMMIKTLEKRDTLSK